MSEYEYVVEFGYKPPSAGSDIIKEEIVRCRDCMYYKPDPYPIDPGWPMYCEDSGRDMIEPDGYCAWGVKRKEGGDD